MQNHSILITGGTGSLESTLSKQCSKENPDIKRLVIYSRDEQSSFKMAQEFPDSQYPGIRYYIGDVRDYERLRRALNGIDTVVHAAAMKHVPIAWAQSGRMCKTNIEVPRI